MKDDRNSKGRLYTKWRYGVFVRDDWKCKHCGSEENLHAHHIEGFYENIELRYEVSNGLTLCSSCHTRHHGKGRIPWNKGKKLDEAGRKKLSEAHKGQVCWQKGKKASLETRAKISASKKGKKVKPCSDERKLKIGTANKETLKKNSEFRKGKTWIKCSLTGKRIWMEKPSKK